MEACELGVFFEQYKTTFLPDLYLFFQKIPGAGGDRVFASFLRVFEGCEFKIPRLEDLRVLQRDVQIFNAISQHTEKGGGRRKEIARLAKVHSMTDAEVVAAYERLRARTTGEKKA